MNSGGAERVASTLANAWVSRGDQVTLMPTFSGRGDCFYELSPDISLIYLADLVRGHKKSFANQFARLKALRRFFVAERPDVIVAFLSNVNVATIVASAGLGIPVVVCERTDPFIFPTSLVLKLARMVTYPFADALMVQTQAVASKYQSAKWHSRQISVIPNPVPQQFLDIERKSIGLDGNKHLIAVGRLTEEKQFDVLIKVFANLADRYSNWSLRIIGEGPLRAVLQQQINDFGLVGRVELSGISANIGVELIEADAFVLASKVEGFPNALLEAMAVGLPCVTFDCPSGPREISADGQFALLVPLNDEPAFRLELEKLMSDADLRQTLGSQARASVLERFTLDTVLEQWELLFRKVGVVR